MYELKKSQSFVCCPCTYDTYGRHTQIRRRKCDFDKLHCDLRPSVQSFCDVARSIQFSHGVKDSDVRFFVAADVPETYRQVLHPAFLGLLSTADWDVRQGSR